LSEAAPDLTLEEAKEAITARGREKGFVTSEDVLEGLPVEDLTPEQVEEFLTQVEDHLRSEGIEVIEVPGEELSVTGAPATVREDDVLKAPTNDPVRMYLKEIGKVPLLTAPQEVDLARRIDAGELATQIIREIDIEDKVDQKVFKQVTAHVVAIREHQLEHFGKVEGIAVDTHVRRLANRIGFSDEHDPDKIEQDLMRLIPRRRWFGFSYVLIDHGRAICQAKKPRCGDCPVEALCPSSQV